jgi:hypothetical protein
MTECTAKHTKYQPVDGDDSDRCPQAHCRTLGFERITLDPKAAPGCMKFHDADEFRCLECENMVGGKAFAAALVKRKNKEKRHGR